VSSRPVGPEKKRLIVAGMGGRPRISRCMDATTWIRREVARAGRRSGDPDDSGTERPTAGYILRDERSGIVIREATTADAPALAAIGSRALQHSHAEVLDLSGLAGLTSRCDLAAVRREMSEEGALWLVALWESNTVGFAELRRNDAPVVGERPLEIHGLYVAPDWMGHGIGSMLARAAIDCARELGFKVLWTAILEGNPGAARFFRSWGFECIGRERYTAGRKVPIDVLVLSRPV
jgi:diamine N-acetyltransferase